MELNKIRDFLPYIFLFSFLVIVSILVFPIKTTSKLYYDYETQKDIPLGKEDYTSIIVISIGSLAIMAYLFLSEERRPFMIRSVFDAISDEKCVRILNNLRVSQIYDNIIEGGELKRYSLGYLGQLRLKNQDDKEILLTLDLRKNYYEFRETPIVGFTLDNITPEKALKRLTPKDVQDTTSQLIDLVKNRDKLSDAEKILIDDAVSKEDDEE